MKQIILALMLAVAGIGVAVAANPIREGNMISGHVLVKGSFCVVILGLKNVNLNNLSL